MSDEYIYTNNWFQTAGKMAWDALLPQFRPAKILEVGSYEGASACYLIAQAAAYTEPEIHCVDTWEGGEEHVQMGTDMGSVEARFLHNTGKAVREAANQVSLHVHKGYSHNKMAELLVRTGGDYFDWIYIDGSHQAPDVLLDAVLAFKLLKVGGILVFDDYLWGQGGVLLHTPKPAIDAFMNIHFNKMSVLSTARNNDVLSYLPLYQLYAIKTAA